MKINFVIDKQYDFEVFFSLLRGKHWRTHIIDSNLDHKFASEIHSTNSDIVLDKLKKKLKNKVDQEYSNNIAYMKKTKLLYQQSWDEIIDEFSNIVEALTAPWFYKNYKCAVTHFCKGVSNWNGNLIGRTWKENPFLQRRITAHEILLAHYFSVHKNYYKDSGLNDRQIWALGEISAWALTGLEPKMKKFWPWDNSGYYTDHNYTELIDLQLKLREPFIKMRSFDEYIKTGIEMVKDYKF